MRKLELTDPPYSTIMPNRYNNFVIEEERSFNEGNTTTDHQKQPVNKLYNTHTFDQMADEMFDIPISPDRGKKVNDIQTSMTSNRGTIKKSDKKMIFMKGHRNSNQKSQQK